MNVKEYFQRAHNDAKFRQQTLSDQRYYRMVNSGIFIVAIVLGGAMTLYPAFTGGSWTEGLEMALPLIILSGCMHEVHRTRIAALEAIDAKETDRRLSVTSRTASPQSSP
jgi:hypothetical protein